QPVVQNVQPVSVNGPLPKPIEEKLRKNQERAESEIAEIYSLLEKNQVSEAYARFQKNRKPLQMFLQQDIFSLLENTVSQAWEFQQEMQ
ncbi:MAG TPA: hypothetical protein VHO70_09135, partial [Chitinispirillaceae bacterium]|nr:hypothetical protein [Chitinispirillaceae bacterium]